MAHKLALVGVGAVVAAAVLSPRGAQANPADKVYFKFNGKTTLVLDKSGFLHTRGDEVINAGTTATNQTGALVIKRNGAAAFSSRPATVAGQGQPPVFAWNEPTTSGEFISAGSYVAELVSSLPLPGETGVLLFKYQGVAKMEFDTTSQSGSPQVLINQFYDRTFSQHPRRDVATLSTTERQDFVDAIIHLQQIKYPGDADVTASPACNPALNHVAGTPGTAACNYCDGSAATSQGLNPHGVGITYHVPGGVTHFAKYDEIHADTHAHAGNDQWPWHREFTNRFEAELQAYDPLVNLHYWNWATTPPASLMAPTMATANFGNATGDIGGAWALAGFSNTGCNLNCLGNDPCTSGCSNPCRESPFHDHVECTSKADCGGNPCLSGHCAVSCTTNTDCGESPGATSGCGTLTDTSLTPPAPFPGTWCTNDVMAIWQRWNVAYRVRTVARSASTSTSATYPGNEAQTVWCHPNNFTGFATAISLIHELGHRAVGDTMNDLGTAARDPIFFLFHAYIDRLLASWQEASGFFSFNPSAQMYQPALDADSLFLSQTNHTLWGFIQPNDRPAMMEGLFTPLEPWADLAPSNATFKKGPPFTTTAAGYRNVRPFTDNCGSTWNTPIDNAACLPKNGVDGPTPRAQSITSQDASLLVAAPYDSYVPYPPAYDQSACTTYGLGTVVITQDGHFWSCTDPHCDACGEFDCGPGSFHCDFGQGDIGPVWEDLGACN